MEHGLPTHNILAHGELCEEVALDPPGQLYILYHRVIKMLQHWLLVSRDSLIQKADHGVGLVVPGLHHEGHGVRLCVHHCEKRMVLIPDYCLVMIIMVITQDIVTEYILKSIKTIKLWNILLTMPC